MRRLGIKSIVIAILAIAAAASGCKSRELTVPGSGLESLGLAKQLYYFETFKEFPGEWLVRADCPEGTMDKKACRSNIQLVAKSRFDKLWAVTFPANDDVDGKKPFVDALADKRIQLLSEIRRLQEKNGDQAEINRKRQYLAMIEFYFEETVRGLEYLANGQSTDSSQVSRIVKPEDVVKILSAQESSDMTDVLSLAPYALYREMMSQLFSQYATTPVKERKAYEDRLEAERQEKLRAEQEKRDIEDLSKKIAAVQAAKQAARKRVIVLSNANGRFTAESTALFLRYELPADPNNLPSKILATVVRGGEELVIDAPLTQRLDGQKATFCYQNDSLSITVYPDVPAEADLTQGGEKIRLRQSGKKMDSAWSPLPFEQFLRN